VTRLAWPPRVGVTGRLATVDAGSREEVLQSAALLLSTRQGERIAQPDYGRPEWTFSRPDVEELLALLSDALGVEVQVLRDELEQDQDGWLQRVTVGMRVSEGS
jgi:hypothetical protein